MNHKRKPTTTETIANGLGLLAPERKVSTTLYLTPALQQRLAEYLEVKFPEHSHRMMSQLIVHVVDEFLKAEGF